MAFARQKWGNACDKSQTGAPARKAFKSFDLICTRLCAKMSTPKFQLAAEKGTKFKKAGP
jgi:hypothetical protein